MPVTQLQDQGGIGQAIGMVGGYLLGNPARKAKQAQQDIENKRADATANLATEHEKNYGDQVRANIAKDQAATQATTDQGTFDAHQRALASQYTPMLSAIPQGTDAKAWVQSVRNRANMEGFSDKDLRSAFDAEAARVIADHAPKLSDVTHGMAQLPVAKPGDKNGKGSVAGATPQQISKHYMDAAARVLSSDMPDEQKKLAVAQFQKMAADATSGATESERERHDKAMEGIGQQRTTNQITIAGMPGRSSGSGGGYNSDLQPRAQAIEQQAMGAKDIKGALKILETANLTRRDRTEVRQDIMDQFKAPPLAHDTSGLSNAGKEAFNHDVTAWATSGMDPEKQPDPADPKYQKRAAVTGGGGGGAAPAAKTTGPTKTGRSASAPGKPTIFEYSDGSWK